MQLKGKQVKKSTKADSQIMYAVPTNAVNEKALPPSQMETVFSYLRDITANLCGVEDNMKTLADGLFGAIPTKDDAESESRPGLMGELYRQLGQLESAARRLQIQCDRFKTFI